MSRKLAIGELRPVELVGPIDIVGTAASMVPASMFRENPHSQKAPTSATKQDVKPSCMVNADSIGCEIASAITRVDTNKIASNIGTVDLD